MRTALVALVLATAVSCGADEGAGSRRTVTKTTAELVDAPPVEPVPGAASPVAEAELPDDVSPLGSRFAPRRLPIPRVQPGRAASFRVDGERRGWLARLPEHARMHLLTPVYGGGRVYLGGGFSSTRFYALDARTGAMDWVTEASDGGPTAAVVSGEKVLFNTESCTLFVVDQETGRIRWKRWLGDPIMGQPAATDGRVFSGHVRDGGGYGMTAMALGDGRVLWTRDITADVLNAPVLDGESVYFTTMDGVVWRMDQRTGRLRWRRRLDASSAPWLDGEVLHVARRRLVRTEEGRRRKEQAVVLSKQDGEVVREHDAVDAPFVPARPDAAGVQAGWAYEGSRPTVVQGRLYQAVGNEVHARDARTGELLWRRRYTDDTRVRPATAPAVAGAQLVFGTHDGVLYGLDVDTGLTTFAYDVGEPIGAEPTVARGWVYASTTRGSVVGIELADRTIDGWHMWGGDAKHGGPVAATESAHASEPDDERPTEGALRLGGDPRDGELPGFPLRHTRVEARVSGFVARVKVEQTFENPFERAVEAVYLFPLADDAAVDAMELRAGSRVVRGHIRRREEARREYRAARERGVLASLLEQERPNLFRQSVANVRPGDQVRVVLEYTQVLPYEEGSYRFVYPMVAGPRYTPEGSSAPPEAPLGERRDRVEVSITADLGTPLYDVTSPTHSVRVDRRGEAAAVVRLPEGGVRPERDLDVRFGVAGDAPSVGVVASAPAEDAEGYVTLLVHPKLEVQDTDVARRELVFLVDTSSSMHGRPMELARAAMLRALDGLREGDTFRVLSFSDGATALSDAPLAASPDNVERAKRFVHGMQALGATEMVRGVREALDPPEDPARMRIVLLVTDGYIGNETEVFREVDERLGAARLFAFGVGSAVNRYLLSRLAEVGRGDAQVVTLDESPEEAADAFHERIETPYLTDVRVDWGSLSVSDVYPRRVPDLFGDRPLVVHGRYAGGGEGTVTVRGRIAGRAFEQRVPVSLPRAGSVPPRREVQSLWARTAIRDRMLAMALRPTDALREEVTELGLRHALLTQWTSFVAVDEGYRAEEGDPPARVDQPSTLPTGVDFGGDARVPPSSGTSFGYGGLGISGTGMGGGGGYGGGYGSGTIGLGNLGTIGRGAGGGSPMALRSNAGGAVVGGSLDRSAISAVVRRSTASVRRIYEAHLRADPSLEGRIVVRMTIGADGRVVDASVSEDTVGSTALAAAVLGFVRSLRFPEPSGGGNVEVVYPFAFRP